MQEITEVFEEARQINVYENGAKTVYTAGSQPYQRALSAWNAMVAGARQMPAYGVSLHYETVKAMRKGLWVEFDFGRECECGGMPFERLLIEVQKSFTGFNLIRYNAGCGYDGRCFYLDLYGTDMSDLYECLSGLNQQSADR